MGKHLQDGQRRKITDKDGQTRTSLTRFKPGVCRFLAVRRLFEVRPPPYTFHLNSKGERVGQGGVKVQDCDEVKESEQLIRYLAEG